MFLGGLRILLPTASEVVALLSFVVAIFQVLPPTAGFFFELLPTFPNL